ncbi:MAG: hypothetical protein Q8907_12165 [Bacteroidota bacterium]|nr:hypothetical protein [Bacteroidota bacterium]MDP4226450.1 hypothetical protein [Bacteroidota bacterium]MDP4275025.1 hypothetical protein [Bacteroidota bacterium]
MKIFSDQTYKTQVLINGLKNKIELVKNKGLDENFIARLEESNNVIKVENEQIDKLKTEAKSRTRQANQRLDEVKTQVKKAKKIIKLNFDQSHWKDFGITDKR